MPIPSEYIVRRLVESDDEDAEMLPDLSLEFLMGRAMDNAMLNVGLKDVAKCEDATILVPRNTP